MPDTAADLLLKGGIGVGIIWLLWTFIGRVFKGDWIRKGEHDAIVALLTDRYLAEKAEKEKLEAKLSEADTALKENNHVMHQLVGAAVRNGSQ